LSTDTEIDNSGHRAPHSAQTARATRSATAKSASEARCDILQVELGSMEAFPVAAVDGEAVPDPDFVADGADVGGARRHEFPQ
jgi:hypothetical protein